MFVAHRTYPFGTKLKITNLHNQRSIVATVEDRGPYVGPGRDLDLSYAAAQQLGMIAKGVALVSYSKIAPSHAEEVFAR
jgi:rare lipoprotein A